MRVGTVKVDGRAYVDCIDLMNALEGWKPGLDVGGTAVIEVIHKVLDKVRKSCD